jgi:putative Flp pilus-assembly TadE/G-like protein
MRLQRLRDRLHNERGNVLLFTFTMLVFVLIMGGFAIDFAHQATARTELQRTMDAAALAGAGKLGFDDTVFPAVRASAQQYATLNPLRTGTLTLNLNTVNSATGNIVLGIWNAGSFSPSLLGNQVNAVRCQAQTTIPTSFLRLLNIDTLPVVASAIAISNPPALPGCETPILPIAVTPCAFYDANTGQFNNSNGCGTGLTWISSNNICNNSPSSPQSCNSAAWASLDGTNWTANQHQAAITNAGLTTPACNATAPAGGNTYLDNGMVQPTYNLLRDTFVANRTSTLAGGDIIKMVNGSPQVVYQASWGGWEVGVMMVQSSCPPGPMTGTRTISTYSKFVVTQVYDQNNRCVISPNMDPQAAAYCASRDNSLRAVFGYFRCDVLGQVATLEPAPRTALAAKLKLVK